MIMNVILPLCPVLLILPHIFHIYTSLHLVFYLPLLLFPGTGLSKMLLSMCPLSFLDYPFHTLEFIVFMRVSPLFFLLFPCCIGEAGLSLSHRCMTTVVSFCCHSHLPASSLHFLLPLSRSLLRQSSHLCCGLPRFLQLP